MKALVLESYNNLMVKEVPQPVYNEKDLLIRVKACGICGSDVHGMDGSTGRRKPPLIMGHEASGVVERVGNKVSNFQVGDRVTFDSTEYPLYDWFTLKGRYNLSDNRRVLGVAPEEYHRDGAFAEYVSIPAHIAHLLPDRVSFDQAAMVEPVAVATHAINLTDIKIMDTVLVVGTGMIGLFLIQVLQHSNAGKVIAVDIDSKKLDLARQFGADVCISADDHDFRSKILMNSNKRGADVAFEAVGLDKTLQMAIGNVRKGGTVIMIGNVSSEVQFPLQSVVTREIRLQGSCAIAGEYPQALEMIDRGLVHVDPLISATAPLEDGAKWFHRLYQNEPGLYKVILHP
jgi:threonine dehydrogenase-like Zn-dependent dehydrogenase